MRLIKLVAYALFGYALYEFVRGMMNEEIGGNGGGGGRREQSSARSGGGRMSAGISPQNITGPGEGQDVQTQDADGGMARHRVGRGVVNR